MRKVKLDLANKFVAGELYSLDGSTLKFIKYEIGQTMFGEAYIRSIFLDIDENVEKAYNAIGFDFKPLFTGANIIHRNRPITFDQMNEKYGSMPVKHWQQRFNEIIDTGLISEDPFAPTQSQITENGEDPFELYEEAYGIRLWLLYNYGYFILDK